MARDSSEVPQSVPVVCPHEVPFEEGKVFEFAGGVAICVCCKNAFGTFSPTQTGVCRKCR